MKNQTQKLLEQTYHATSFLFELAGEEADMIEQQTLSFAEEELDNSEVTEMLDKVRKSLRKALKIFEGKITGSIDSATARHDFNNSISPALGYTDILMLIDEEPRRKPHYAEILRLTQLGHKLSMSVLSQTRIELDEKEVANFTLPEGTRTLAIDDDREVISALGRTFKAKKLQFDAVSTRTEFDKWLEGIRGYTGPTCVLLDHQLEDKPGGITGKDLLKDICEACPHAQIVVHTGDSEVLASGDDLYPSLPRVSKMNLQGIKTAFEKGAKLINK